MLRRFVSPEGGPAAQEYRWISAESATVVTPNRRDEIELPLTLELEVPFNVDGVVVRSG
jgi:hypothetical protein